uniref:Uncharacterized protein n=1 Tax=Siphoviridae sp. ctCNm48 TaxID=2825377 RepID=A0A8S5TWB7_9CAUD|nr:MAG TPA: hypothetical protein [Siphoviridae sp. ctCNm48]
MLLRRQACPANLLVAQKRGVRLPWCALTLQSLCRASKPYCPQGVVFPPRISCQYRHHDPAYTLVVYRRTLYIPTGGDNIQSFFSLSTVAPRLIHKTSLARLYHVDRLMSKVAAKVARFCAKVADSR